MNDASLSYLREQYPNLVRTFVEGLHHILVNQPERLSDDDYQQGLRAEFERLQAIGTDTDQDFWHVASQRGARPEAVRACRQAMEELSDQAIKTVLHIYTDKDSMWTRLDELKRQGQRLANSEAESAFSYGIEVACDVEIDRQTGWIEVTRVVANGKTFTAASS